MVCPPLSNGLVQLVCEDGGIVSLLILPQPRPFMRPNSRARAVDADIRDGIPRPRRKIPPSPRGTSRTWTTVSSPQGAARPQRRVVAHVIPPHGGIYAAFVGLANGLLLIRGVRDHLMVDRSPWCESSAGPRQTRAGARDRDKVRKQW